MITCSIDIQEKLLNFLKKLGYTHKEDIINFSRSFSKNQEIDSIENLIESFTNQKENLKTYLHSIGIIIKENTVRVPKKALSVSNIDSNFTMVPIDPLFTTLHVAKGYFDQSSNHLIMSALYIGDESNSKYPNTNKELNININNLKNKLFKTIIDYLINKGKLAKEDYYSEVQWGEETIQKFTKNLFDTTGFNKTVYNSEYRKVIKLLETLLLGDSDENAIVLKSSGRKIPNLSGNIRKPSDRMKFDAYNAAVLLLNFDSIILQEYKGIIDLNKTSFNAFEPPMDGVKYFKKVKGLVTEFWSNDDFTSDGVDRIQDKLSHKLISIIPAYNKKGVLSGRFLEMRDITGLGASLQKFQIENIIQLSKFANWESLEENPIKALNWYLNSILEAYDENFLGIMEKDEQLPSSAYLMFKNKIDIVRSISNFLETIKAKEDNSTNFSISRIITQSLINSIGATYSTDFARKHLKSYKEMHTHNSERVQLQEGFYSHLKNNITNYEKFDLTKDQIKSYIDKDVSGVWQLIQKILGISLQHDSIRDLIEHWTKNIKNEEDKTKALVNIFSSILDKIFPEYKKDKAVYESSLFAKIEENEKNIDELHFDEVVTTNEIISDLSQSKYVQDILDAKLDTMIVRILTTITNQSGKQIPTLVIPSLGQNDSSVLRERIKIEKDPGYNGTYKNYFTNVGGLLGTVIKLDGVGEDENKDADKYNIIENFTSHFEFDFLESFKDNGYDSINLMIGNYSDKGRILNKRINKYAKWNGDFIIGKSPSDSGRVMSSDEIWKTSNEQSKNYYNDLMTKVIKDYETLTTLDSNFKKSYKSAKSIEEKINSINNYLKTLKYEDFLEKINSIKGIDFTEELHYSVYKTEKEKIVAINQTLFDYFVIHNNSEYYEAFKENQKESFIHKLLDQKNNKNILFTFDKIDLINTIKGVENPNLFGTILTMLGINSKEYEKRFITEENDHKIYYINSKGETILNPLLDKWLAVNEFFRNEYLYMTVKPEYMHPAKNSYREKNKFNNINDFLEAFNSESAIRLSGMAKRNVSYTGTTELPSRNSQYGVTDNVNVVVINDVSTPIFNIAGDKEPVDIHDGSSVLHYAYSKMISNSFQSKGYDGTKKQLATFITEFGSALKKDAESIITNDKIRNSRKSEINFRNKQQQINNIPITISNFDSGTLSSYNKYFSNGSYYTITSYSIENNNLILNLSKYDLATKTWIPIPSVIKHINNLFDIWEAFGGEYSIDDNFKFDESSNEQLFNLVVNYKEKDINNNTIYPLKDKMVHIISNHSAFKSGATNIHPESYWKNNKSLKYTTFRNRNMGIQLDAGHDITNSETREVTQLISALSQNPDTADKAKELYQALSNIIKQAAERSYDILSKNITRDKLEELYNKLSRDLIHNLATSNNKGLAKTIAETFEYGKALPFSNQNFFKDFVKDLINKMNRDFITRYYPGTGAVLVPSHKIIQIFENNKGETFTQGEILNLAINDYHQNPQNYLSLEGNQLFTEQIIDRYLDINFQDGEEIPASNIQLGDSVKITKIEHFDEPLPQLDATAELIEDNGQGYDLPVEYIISLDTLDKYYDFKKEYEGQLVKKVYNVTRDLKPIEITYDVKVNLQINDVFPNSEIKDIVYHGTSQSFDFFSLNRTRLISNEDVDGIYFTKDPKFALEFAQINYLKQLYPNEDVLGMYHRHKEELEKNKDKFRVISAYINKIDDSTIIRDINVDEISKTKLNNKEYIVKNPENIHIINLNNTEKRNLFDLDPVKLKYAIKNTNKNDLDQEILKQFKSYFKISDSKVLERKLIIWTQRSLQVLNKGKALRDIKDFMSPEGNIDFATYFGNDDLSSIIFDDYQAHYMQDSLSQPIMNYTKKAAELVLGNIYKDVFKTGKDSMALIRKEGPEYFRKKLENIYKFEDGIKADFKIVTDEKEHDVYVRFVENGKLPPMNEDRISRNVVTDYNEDGTIIRNRIGTNGEVLYQIPLNSSLDISREGYDILYIEAGELKEIKNDESKEKSFQFIRNPDVNSIISTILRSFDSNIEGIVPVMNNVLEWRNAKSYNFNNLTFNWFKKYSGYIHNGVVVLDQNYLQNNLEDILDQVSQRTYVSWEKSHNFIAARIPAQSMQSFMEMKNVGYFDTESNDAYVSVWQIFIQGSDFDIDKAYMMGYGFNKAGHLEVWNDLFNFSTKEELDIIEKMPIPSGEKINKVNNIPVNGVTDISSEFNQLVKILDKISFEEGENPSEKILKLILDKGEEEISLSISDFGVDALSLMQKILTKVLRKNEISIVYDFNEESQKEYQLEIFNFYQKFIVELINKYNTSKFYNQKKFASVNSVITGIRDIISSPVNQILANKPVQIQSLNDGADQAFKIKMERTEFLLKKLLSETNKGENKLTKSIIEEIESIFDVKIINSKKLNSVNDAINYAIRISKLKNTLSAHDMLSMFKQQVDASVGKIDVGIGANGLKVMFALNNYYNDYYKSLHVNLVKDPNTGQITKVLADNKNQSVDFNTDPKWFKKVFHMGEPLGIIIKTTIADVNINQELKDSIIAGYGLEKFEKELQFILNGEAALHASGFVSGATDNAKALIMAKINAIGDLSSMHLYLMALGFTSQEVALYMNSDIASWIVKKINSVNIFDGKSKVYISSLIKEYIKDFPEQEVLAKTFLDIYEGSKEFSNLASMLKINQKVSADVENLFLFLNQINKSMYLREHSVLGNNLIKLQNGTDLEKIIEIIVNSHPNNISPKYVQDVLKKASNIKVNYINSEGITESKIVSMIGGKFDIRYYIYPGNEEYKKAAIEYYNLFKNTINLFDVIENSPHFKAMIEGLSVTHNKALIVSKKYNFVFNTAVDIINSKSSDLYKNNKDRSSSVKTIFGNAALPIDLSEKEIGRLLRGYDGFLIANWLKEQDTNNFKFSVQELLKQSGDNSIQLYGDDNAKTEPVNKENNFVVKVNKDSGEDFIIDLTTDYGIANFKRMMENLVLPILQSSKKAELGKMLRTKSVKNPYGLFTSQIVSTFGLSSLDSDVNIEKYQELLNYFNEVDIKSEIKIHNIFGSEVRYQDLFYLYNLIVNNEAYGDNRLTPIFQDYVKDPTTIGYKYLNYSRDVDMRKVDIFKIDVDPTIINANEKENIFNKLKDNWQNDIIFLAFQKKGKLFLQRLNGKLREVSLQNSDFVINTFMDIIENKDTKKQSQFLSLLALLKDSNLLIHFKCN